MRDRWFVALVALCLASLGFLTRVLVYPDLNLDYPFPGEDGLDWISNGLWWAGIDVRYTLRPPLLPWILAGLHRVGLLPWFPVVNQLLLHGGVLGLFVSLRRRYPSPVAFVVAVLFLVNASLLALTLVIGADLLAAVLLMCAALAVVEARQRPGLYPLAGLLGGFSALAQQTALLLPLPVALCVLFWRRNHLRERRLWAGMALFAAPPALWFLAKYLQFGSPGDVVVQHWSLLGLGLESAPYCAGSLLSWLGWPWAVAAAIGVALWSRGPSRDETCFLGSVALIILLFFAFAYQWRSERFLVYAVPFLAFPTAELLARIRRPLWLALVGSALAVGSATPSGRLEQAFLVWPAPAVVAHSPVNRADWKIDRRPWAELWSESPYSLVLGERPARGARSLDPSLVAGDSAVVVLYSDSLPVQRRRQMLYRVGNALERRVRLVPEVVLPPDWWGWRSRTFLGSFGPFFLERIEISPELGPVAIVRGDEPFSNETELGPGPSDRALEQAIRWCRTLDGLLAFDDDHLTGVLRPSGAAPLWLQVLPFVTRTTSFYVIDAKTAGRVLSTEPVEERVRVGAISATRVMASGLEVWVAAE